MICFYRGSGAIGAAIRWQTRGRYAHVGWMLGNGTSVEAWQVGGVRHVESPWALHTPDTLVDIYSVRCLTAWQVAKLQSFLLRQVGSGYDWMGCVRFLSHINRNNMERWFCSELVAEACESAGRPLLKADGYKLSPETLSWSTELVPVLMGATFDWWNERFGKC
jgi:uncharacterized protein YycO